MKTKNINITVSGQVGVGKSRVTFLLKQFLREKGFEVNFTGSTDHPSESDFDKQISSNIETVIDSIKETSGITLTEVQEKRSI
jgi:thymidylate kinase